MVLNFINATIIFNFNVCMIRYIKQVEAAHIINSITNFTKNQNYLYILKK